MNKYKAEDFLKENAIQNLTIYSEGNPLSLSSVLVTFSKEVHEKNSPVFKGVELAKLRKFILSQNISESFLMEFGKLFDKYLDEN